MHATRSQGTRYLYLPSGAARACAQLGADPHRQNVFRGLRRTGCRGAGRFRIAIGRRADAALGADRSGAERRTLDGPRTYRSHIGGTSCSLGDRRASSPRGSVHTSSRVAPRDRHRLARARTHCARTNDSSSNGSRGSRGSRGGVPKRFQVFHWFQRPEQPWNPTELLEPFGTKRLEPVGTLGTLLVLCWFVFCWILSGLSVWRGSTPAPETWLTEARRVGRRIGFEGPIDVRQNCGARRVRTSRGSSPRS